MKKLNTLFTALSVLITTLSIMSCASTALSRSIELPEDPVEAAHKIVAYEKAGEYLYHFTGVNYRNAECEIKIYDDRYLKISYPASGSIAGFDNYYYYKFTGDYFDKNVNNNRVGIFGTIVGITVSEVNEFVLTKNIIGGYKFKNRYDSIMNDKHNSRGLIIWNEYPEAKMPSTDYFLDFLEERDKKLSDKRELARPLYTAITELNGYTVTIAGESADTKGAN